MLGKLWKKKEGQSYLKVKSMKTSEISKMIRESSRTSAKKVVSDDEVRERAYLLWESAGCPECNPDDFWFQALEELQNLNEEVQLESSAEV